MHSRTARGNLTCTMALIVLLTSCKNEGKKIEAKFSDGTPSVVIEYQVANDTSNYIIKSFYRSGNLRQTAKIVDGKFIGPAITYYPNGKISEIDSLDNTRTMSRYDWDGIATRFYENGKIAERFVIKNANRNGLSQHYSPKGILVKEYSITNDSIKNGVYKEFHPNGKVSIMDTYKNDTLVGFEYIFNENGDTLRYNQKMA